MIMSFARSIDRWPHRPTPPTGRSAAVAAVAINQRFHMLFLRILVSVRDGWSVMLTFPYHKYLGPGNDVPNGVPVDIDDYLAFLHDLEYVHNNIEDSDVHFARDFFIDFLTNGNTHSLLGAIGLQGKHLIEKFFGRIYPPMAPTTSTQKSATHRGNRLYAEKQKELSRLFKEAKKRGDSRSWAEFVRGHWEGQGSSTSKPETTTFATEPPSLPSPELSANDFNMEDLLNDAFMEIDTPGTSASAGKSGAIMSQSGETRHLTIPRSIGCKKFHYTFTKSRIMYSYGYNFTPMDWKENKTPVTWNFKLLTTPFMEIPVSYLGFYCNPQEALLLQRGHTRVVHADCSVVPQGLRVAFDTGTTLSSTATSEHCVIGMHAIGLNKKVYGRCLSYKTNSTSPMIPNGWDEIKWKDFLIKMYGKTEMDGIPMSLGVPRSGYGYFVLRENVAPSAAVPNPTYNTHYEGWPCLDKYYDRWNYPPAIGKKIVKWQYKPKNGWINVKFHDIPFGKGNTENGETLRITQQSEQQVKVQMTKDDNTTAASTRNDTNYVSKRSGIDTDVYMQMHIDSYKIRDFSNRHHPPTEIIPSLHVGILPVPAINPGAETTSVVNSCAYWSIKNTIVIEVDQESHYGHQDYIHSRPDEVVLFEKDMNYTLDDAKIKPFAKPTYGT